MPNEDRLWLLRVGAAVRRALAWIVQLMFGYDVFVSYARGDALQACGDLAFVADHPPAVDDEKHPRRSTRASSARPIEDIVSGVRTVFPALRRVDRDGDQARSQPMAMTTQLAAAIVVGDCAADNPSRAARP